jgi:DNA-binding NtrC family response regulator
MSTVRTSFAEREFPVPVAAGPLLGNSEAMRHVLRLIEAVSSTEAGVLLTGESGSGKELAARSIHDRSLRRGGPFVGINCGAIPKALMEAEMSAAFERAQGGTLLLDEVTELPMDMQSRLLRVLETGRIYRPGAGSDAPTDVRVIAATNRCPLQAVKAGRLREDLLYRLAVFPIELPALRNRANDVDLLAEHFLDVLNARHRTQKRLSAAARMMLRQHTWPGNVRELKNCIERAFILGDQTLELAPLIQVGSGASNADEQGVRGRLDIRVGSRIHDMERSLIEATLDYFKGNKRRAADALGCSLKTLYNKLNGYSQSQECARS